MGSDHKKEEEEADKNKWKVQRGSGTLAVRRAGRR